MDFLIVILEYLILHNLPIRKHIERLMCALPDVGAFLEHAVSNGTIFILVGISLVVLDE